ncbi:hypothetical protein LTR91_003798 [Friedmanniomyces endolithicus]|uniref:Uncharacterized protein n=1 Tax=Friedmanniomyces endolithicus TaxID=329885 RepID=A0AAN6KYE3_9PEZI|nr:hypothetical protein LTR57_003556 [Friedmanniomyces endolithicus]KAK0986382.1 hypothetical protein LTS01_009907 [Friedmanniomyces endolithicus]KAK1005873.1 hypothetical protein LTR91_003798 [Friedmanniomyces endolithicus]KAK1043966.1 hypothetical protein LTS16_007557 [Friedmanniomyces endolithicus]
MQISSTNPVECWSYTPSNKRDGDSARSKATGSAKAASRPDAATQRSFNWLKDPDGLHSMFPSARIMLYDYASAWKGSRKVRATMKSICTVLLDNLTDKRKARTRWHSNHPGDTATALPLSAHASSAPCQLPVLRLPELEE